MALAEGFHKKQGLQPKYHQYEPGFSKYLAEGFHKKQGLQQTKSGSNFLGSITLAEGFHKKQGLQHQMMRIRCKTAFATLQKGSIKNKEKIFSVREYKKSN